jgi:hypothetical protein
MDNPLLLVVVGGTDVIRIPRRAFRQARRLASVYKAGGRRYRASDPVARPAAHPRCRIASDFLFTEKKPMTRLRLCLALALALTAGAAQAEVSLNSVRVVAKDAEALGRFYAAAFGLKETNGNTGIFIAFVVDPEGNRIELIQPAAR